MMKKILQSNLGIAIATKYSEIVKYYLNLNSHFDVAFFIDSGEASSIFSAGYGDLYLLYDGIFYNSIEFGVGLKNVIYIPDTTPDTHEDYIEAVTNRLNSYMPDVDFEVSFGGELSKEDLGDDYQYYIGSTFYIIKINGKSYSFIVETKLIDELTSPVFTGKDTETGITIESSSSDIPLDTKVEVNEIEEETSEFTDISNKLDTNNFYAFDINMNSGEDTIDKIIHGDAIIIVPLEDSSSKYYVYHINDDDSIDMLDSQLDNDGNLTFNTNLFDTYIISSKNINSQNETNTPETVVDSEENYIDIENLQTGDNIMHYIVLGIVSIIMTIVSIFMLKKKIRITKKRRIFKNANFEVVKLLLF